MVAVGDPAGSPTVGDSGDELEDHGLSQVRFCPVCGSHPLEEVELSFARAVVCPMLPRDRVLIGTFA